MLLPGVDSTGKEQHIGVAGTDAKIEFARVSGLTVDEKIESRRQRTAFQLVEAIEYSLYNFGSWPLKSNSFY